MEWLIGARYALTPRKKLTNAGVVVEEGVIVEVGDFEKLKHKYPRYERIGGREYLLVPGFVNAHTHVAMTLFRGVEDDKPLNAWLREAVWPKEAKLRPEDCYAGALLGCLEMVLNGVTCFLDMYFYEEEVGKAAKEVGIRAFLGVGVIDFPLPDAKTPKEALKNAEKLRKKGYRVVISPHSLLTCSKETLEMCKEAAKGDVIHMHVSETEEEVERVKRKYGKPPFFVLEELGMLEKLVAAHATWISREELRLVAERECSLVACPSAAMKLSYGRVVPVVDALNVGANVCLGTDGAGSNNRLDILLEGREILLYAKNAWGAESLKAEQVLEFMTSTGAKALGLNAGEIKEGREADLVLINMDKPHWTPCYDPCSNLLYASLASDVDCVFVKGELIVEGGKHKKLELEKVAGLVEKAKNRLA